VREKKREGLALIAGGIEENEGEQHTQHRKREIADAEKNKEEQKEKKRGGNTSTASGRDSGTN